MSRFVLALLCALVPQLSFAHAHLKASTPSENAVVSVKQAPHRIELHFSEAVEPMLSKIEIHSGTKTGEKVAVGPIQATEGKSGTLTIPLLKPLTAGTYWVSWKVVSADTHKSEGEFSFQVK